MLYSNRSYSQGFGHHDLVETIVDARLPAACHGQDDSNASRKGLDVFQKVFGHATASNGFHGLERALALFASRHVVQSHGRPSQRIETVFVATAETDQESKYNTLNEKDDVMGKFKGNRRC